MSLSRWLRSYLYIPLGGNRNASFGTWFWIVLFALIAAILSDSWVVPTIFLVIAAVLLILAQVRPQTRKSIVANTNRFVTMLLGGLWHGASWNFIIWGLYFGMFILIERTIGNKRMRKMPTALAHIYNTIVVVIGFGIFYFTDLGKLGTFLGNLIGLNGNAMFDMISTKNMMANAWLVIVCIILCMPVVPALKKKLESMDLYLVSTTGQTILNVASFALSSILLVNATNNPFIYWQF